MNNISPLLRVDEGSEDFYIGFGDFLFDFSKKKSKCSNNHRSAFIHINVFMFALRYIFEFNSSSFANRYEKYESQNSAKSDKILVSKLEFNFQTFPAEKNNTLI